MFVGEKMKNKKRFLSILGVVLSAIFVFFIGFGACWFTLDSEMRTLIQVKRKIDREYYQEISNDLFYDAVFDAVNNSVLDGYSEYMNPDDYADVNADLAGNRSGLGVVFLTRDSEDNPQMLVSRVCGNSPAASAGIVEGDKLIAMIHFPPFGMKRESTLFTELFEAHGVDKAVFGHIHGSVYYPLKWEHGGVEYMMASCDKVGFKLVKIY